MMSEGLQGGGSCQARLTRRDLAHTRQVAPPAVEGLTVVAEPDAKGQYRLKWAASAAGDVRYYNVYFSAKGRPEAVQARRIASLPATSTEYLDWAAPVTGKAHYAVTAVDRQGNESPPARGSAEPQVSPRS